MNVTDHDFPTRDKLLIGSVIPLARLNSIPVYQQPTSLPFMKSSERKQVHIPSTVLPISLKSENTHHLWGGGGVATYESYTTINFCRRFRKLKRKIKLLKTFFFTQYPIPNTLNQIREFVYTYKSGLPNHLRNSR